ncbi:hypothetical protein QOZ95_005138 [Paenibacillus brasilensis]|uniref:Uncharacterized protein n=1 Tax=Paenibacillus brasilensis TaxID=128574 RepID=A0ABU0L6L7_9BACL|nr:hypothetical protein [Paenibacillus brasilensis]
MKSKVILSFLVTGFILVAIVVPPLQHQDKGSTYEPNGQHGGM